MYALVDSRGQILSRSPSRDYLLLQQKRLRRQNTKILSEKETFAAEKAARARAGKEAKQRAGLQRAWWARSTQQSRQGKLISSSFVSYLEYDPKEQKVHCILSGKKYTFFNVPQSRFDAWYDGAAACDTNDPTGLKRWWIDKHPSLGAFFNDKIKNAKNITYVRGWI